MRLEKGGMPPQGMKLLGEWRAISGGQVFRLIDLEDPKAGLQAVLAWSDFGKIDNVPSAINRSGDENWVKQVDLWQTR